MKYTGTDVRMLNGDRVRISDRAVKMYNLPKTGIITKVQSQLCDVQTVDGVYNLSPKSLSFVSRNPS